MTETPNPMLRPAGVRAVQLALILLGALGTLLGCYILFTTVKPNNIAGLGIWLFAALALHDGILAPLLYLLNRGLRGLAKPRSGPIMALVQGGVLLGGLLTLVVVPAIVAKHEGPRNTTVLNLPYTQGLFWAWIVITVIVLGGACLVLARRHRPVTGEVEVVTVAKVQPDVKYQQDPAPNVAHGRKRWLVPVTVLVGGALALLLLWRRR